MLLTESKLFLFVLPPLTEDADMFEGRVLWRVGSIPPKKSIKTFKY